MIAVAEMERLLGRLWPIMRSITGAGQRQTHEILAELVPLSHWDMPSGTAVLDWNIPQEWVFRDAYVIDPLGRRLLDAKANTLHLVNYSRSFSGSLSLEQLQPHLHSLPLQPQAIPYVTSYYADHWGFCLSQEMRDSLTPGEYRVVVDTDLVDGVMRVSDCILPRTEGDEAEGEVLFSSYTCHPSLANNELSGPVVLAFLYRTLAALPRRRLNYRFVLGPENIGSIAYLSRIERERENPPPDRLVSALARALGLPADGLFAAAKRLPPDLRARTEDVIAVYRQQTARRG